MQTRTLTLIIALAGTMAALIPASADTARWSEAKANAWYAKQPWLVGSNYTPASAINELEMWQADTFDPAAIDKELGWAEGLGMTTMRVFLHDLPWQQDAAGLPRADRSFLDIADEASHQAAAGAVRLVLGSAAEAGPAARADAGRAQLRLGAGPGREGAAGSGAVPAAEGVRHGRRRRLRARTRACSAGTSGTSPTTATAAATRRTSRRTRSTSCWRCCRRCSPWAREAGAEQPLTSGVWKGDWSSDDKLSPMERIQLEQSDVISFHNYDSGAGVREAHPVAAALAAPDPLHRVHGARQRQHVPGIAADAQRSTTSARSTGASSRARRRPTCRGTRGRRRTSNGASRRCGSTKCFARTARLTSRKKWS